jgi:hypothetical protein
MILHLTKGKATRTVQAPEARADAIASRAEADGWTVQRREPTDADAIRKLLARREELAELARNLPTLRRLPGWRS